MKSLAAVAREPNSSLSIEEVELNDLREDEVLVRIVASGVCQTDAHRLSGKDGVNRFPVILGHEGAGIVEDVGRNVKTVRPDDHVIPLYVPECGTCASCVSSRTNVCDRLLMHQFGRSSFSQRGKRVYQFMGTSTFSQYTILPEIAVAKISDKAPLEKVCLLGCGISTGIGAVLKTARVRAGTSVAVFGLGATGLSVVQGAVMARAERIIGIDINPEKEALARALGATDFINPRDSETPIEKLVVDESKGGVDYSFECVGDPALVRAAVASCRPGWGESILIGVPDPAAEVSLSPMQFIQGRVLRGSLFGGIKGRTELPTYVDKYLEGEIRIDDFVTAEISLVRINEAFDALQNRVGIRTVVRLDERV